MATNFEYDDYLDARLLRKAEEAKNMERTKRFNNGDSEALLELLKSNIHELKSQESELIRKI